MLGQGVFVITGLSEWIRFAELRSQPLAAVRLLAALILLGTALGAVLGAWLALCLRAGHKLESHRARLWVTALVAVLPVAVLGMWVPSGWIVEHWASLPAGHRVIAIGLYPAIQILATLAAVGFGLAAQRLARRTQTLPAWYWPAAAVLLSSAACLRWADINILPGLYHDFHVGLSGGFGLTLAAALTLGCVAWVRTPGFLPNARRRVIPLSAAVAGLAMVVLGASSWAGARPRGIHRVVASSAFVELGWGLADLRLLLGDPCTPVVTSGTAALDIPGNGVDEDCTGSDLEWPPPLVHQPSTREPKRYNILLISVEAMRPDRMSVYGYHRETSRNIEALARGGWLFTNAYSQDTKTWNSLPSLHTGLYPSNLPRDYARLRRKAPKTSPNLYYLTEEAPVLAELLAQQGYHSYAVARLSFIPVLGLDRGFDRLEISPQITRKARQFLKRTRPPFFLWLHYSEPHNPYKRYKRFDFGDSAIDRYDGELAEADRQIGALLRTLRSQNLEKNTIVIVTADHGEEFGEHGGQYHDSKPYRELNHVPLVFKVPKTSPAVIRTPVELADIVPTLRDLVGLRPEAAEFDGQSLLAAVAGRRSPTDVGAYSETYVRDLGVIRRGLFTHQWHAIQNLQTNQVELYDIVADPFEQTDLAQGHEEVYRPLLDKIAARSLRRAGEIFRSHQTSGDPLVLAKGLSKLRQDPLIRLALDKLSNSPRSDEIRAAVSDLLGRPWLTEERRIQARELLARP